MTINLSQVAVSPVSPSPLKLDGLPKLPVEQEPSTTKLADKTSVEPDNLVLLKANERQDIAAADGKTLPAKKPDRQELDTAVTKLNDFVQSIQRDLQFSVDDDSGTVVVKVIDRSSGDVIRQAPQENVLKMVQNLQQFKEGQLFEAKA